jgi:flagellar assembly factor FliW
MRIALFLHGLFDSSQDNSSKGLDGFEHIKKHILSVGNVDVFVHSWSVDKKDTILRLYSPIDYVFEEQVDFSNIVKSRRLNLLKNTPRNPSSIFSHFYSISNVFNLINVNDYDVIIKSRFDLGRINRNSSGPGKSNPFSVQCINFNPNVKPGKIYMANWNYFDMGPADMWFYGDSSVMNKFKDLYSYAFSNIFMHGDFYNFARKIENNEGNVSNSIVFYKWWMIKVGLWDNKILLDSKWE